MSAAVGTDGALNGMMRCALQTRVPRGAQVKNLLSKVKLGKEKEVKEIIGRNPAILKDAFDVQGNSVLHLAALNGCPPPPPPVVRATYSPLACTHQTPVGRCV